MARGTKKDGISPDTSTMNIELEKLEKTRDEIMAELNILRPEQVKNPHLSKRIIHLSIMYGDCLKMIAMARAYQPNTK